MAKLEDLKSVLEQIRNNLQGEGKSFSSEVGKLDKFNPVGGKPVDLEGKDLKESGGKIGDLTKVLNKIFPGGGAGGMVGIFRNFTKDIGNIFKSFSAMGAGKAASGVGATIAGAAAGGGLGRALGAGAAAGAAGGAVARLSTPFMSSMGKAGLSKSVAFGQASKTADAITKDTVEPMKGIFTKLKNKFLQIFKIFDLQLPKASKFTPFTASGKITGGMSELFRQGFNAPVNTIKEFFKSKAVPWKSMQTGKILSSFPAGKTPPWGAAAGAAAGGAATTSAAASGTAKFIGGLAVAAGALTKLTLGIGIVVVGFVALGTALMKMGKMLIEMNRSLAESSPAMAIAFAFHDLRKMFRDMRSGNARAEATSKLMEKWDNIMDGITPWFDALYNLVANIMTKILALVEMIVDAVNFVIDKIPIPEKGGIVSKAFDAGIAFMINPALGIPLMIAKWAGVIDKQEQVVDKQLEALIKDENMQVLTPEIFLRESAAGNYDTKVRDRAFERIQPNW